MAHMTKDGAKELRVSIRLTADLRRRIEAAAAKGGTRESVIVREALERGLPRRVRRKALTISPSRLESSEWRKVIRAT
jgi:hypothetical protein